MPRHLVTRDAHFSGRAQCRLTDRHRPLRAAHTHRRVMRTCYASRPLQEHARIREQSLHLALVCLGYDFIGTTLDEASEELGTIQVGSRLAALP